MGSVNQGYITRSNCLSLFYQYHHERTDYDYDTKNADDLVRNNVLVPYAQMAVIVLKILFFFSCIEWHFYFW